MGQLNLYADVLWPWLSVDERADRVGIDLSDDEMLSLASARCGRTLSINENGKVVGFDVRPRPVHIASEWFWADVVRPVLTSAEIHELHAAAWPLQQQIDLVNTRSTLAWSMGADGARTYLTTPR